jgi:hypothetical protein
MQNNQNIFMQNTQNNQNLFMQNMLMQNAQNMLNINKIFDPSKEDSRIKKDLILKNIAISKIGQCNAFSKCPSITYSYLKDYSPGIPDNICNIEVINEHSIEVAEKFCLKGNINHMYQNGLNPVVLNVVASTFTGNNFESNDDIRDEIINMRTTFNNTIGTENPYPIKKNGCIYSKFVFVIRPKYPYIKQVLNVPNMYRFALINAAPIHKPKLNNKNQMCASDYIKTISTIEAIFQGAIAYKHLVLILTPFGHLKDENPIDDIIKIYNYCILKYGHKFKNIIFAISPHYPKEIFEKYNSKIIKIQTLFDDIDSKYNEIEMLMKLKNTKSLKNNNQNESIKEPLNQISNSNAKSNMNDLMKNPAFLLCMKNFMETQTV